MSQPGVPQNNGVIERTNLDVRAGATACLSQAGLPRSFWSFAVPYYCLLHDTDTRLGASCYFRAFGERFPGLRIPFGCKVSFLPAPTKQCHDGKWEPKLVLGVFAGYKIRPGYTWQGEYLVWDLDELVGITVAHYVEPYPSLRSPHVTNVWKCCRMGSCSF